MASPNKRRRTTYPSGSSGTMCSAYGCFNYRSNSSVAFYSFPKDKDRRDRWIINIRREDLHGKENLTHARLCSVHFEDSQFSNPNDRKSRLKPQAVPTIVNVPNPPKPVTLKRRTLVRASSGFESESVSLYDNENNNSAASKDSSTMTDLTKDDVDALKSTIQRLQKENFDLRRKLAYKKTSSISSKLALKNNLKKFLPPAAHKFVGHQIDFSTKRNKGIRWPDDLKTFALQLKGISTRAYIYVKKIFKLPAIRTLHQTLNALQIKEGFHEPVLKALEQQTTVLEDAEKIVVVAYDEMSLKQRLYYNRSEDRIEGIKPNTDNSTSLDMNIINHASVFMVRSITGKWKQPIGYFETAGTMTPIILSDKIVESVSLLQNVGLKPVAFVCDQGANNRSAMKHLCFVVTSLCYVESLMLNC